MELRRKTRPEWEYFFVSAVVIATLWLSLALYAKRDQVYKEKILMQELATMRNEVATYLLEHRKFPQNSWFPFSEQSEREGEAPPALPVEGATRAPIIDPFGNVYHYNAETGHIQSPTDSYQNW